MKFNLVSHSDIDDSTTYQLMLGDCVIARLTEYKEDGIAWQYFGVYVTAQHWREPRKDVTRASEIAHILLLALNDEELHAEQTACAAAVKKIRVEAKARALAK